VPDPRFGADSRFPMQAAFQHRSVELCPRCCSAVPCTSIAPSAATALLLSRDSIHRIRSASGRAMLSAQSGHVSHIPVCRGDAKSAHSGAGVSIAVMDNGAAGIRSKLVGGGPRSSNRDE
jgi:hypothetical protein